MCQINSEGKYFIATLILKLSPFFGQWITFQIMQITLAQELGLFVGLEF